MVAIEAAQDFHPGVTPNYFYRLRQVFVLPLFFSYNNRKVTFPSQFCRVNRNVFIVHLTKYLPYNLSIGFCVIIPFSYGTSLHAQLCLGQKHCEANVGEGEVLKL